MQLACLAPSFDLTGAPWFATMGRNEVEVSSEIQHSEQDYLEMVKELVLGLIPKDEYAVFLFGSRARGNLSRFADVDIGLLGHHRVPFQKIYELRNAIEDSIIPLQVDFVDFFYVDENFKKIALKDIELWNLPSSIKLNTHAIT